MPKRTPPSNLETTLKKRFGATVRAYRQRLGISQEELAWRADMHRTYLADVERGARNLSLSSMSRLVSAIGIPLSTFFAALERDAATSASSRSQRSRPDDGVTPLKRLPNGTRRMLQRGKR